MSKILSFLKFPLALTFVMALLLDDSWHDSVAGSRGGGLAIFSDALRYIFVEPMGYWPALGFAFGIGCFVAGFFYLPRAGGENSLTDEEVAGETWDYVQQLRGQREQELHGARMRKVFGKSTAFAEKTARQAEALRLHEQRWEEQRPQRRVEAAKKALTILESNGFDWYFAHYGDGVWRDACAGLRDRGEDALADLLAQAGPIWEESQAVVVSRDGEDLTQEETTAYFARLKPLDRAKWQLFEERAAQAK